MIQQPAKMPERLSELLTDRALFGLDTHEQSELDSLLAAHPGVEPVELELLAASVDLALGGGRFEPLPPALRDQIKADAGPYLAESRTDIRPKTVSPFVRQSAQSGWHRRELIAWLVTAASVLVAFGIWSGRERRTGPEATLTLAEQRQQLLRDAPDVIQANWQTQDQPEAVGASGDVVWSNSRQQGFMRIQGLAANDPQQEQYQLWIIDNEQDQRYPIDGGVFNVGDENEVIVPIDAKLQVAQPIAFAVTIEKPGGVVVSSRDRLPLLATVEERS